MLRLIEGVPAVTLDKPKRTLVVSDLHLGFEEELLAQGIKVPPQSWRIIQNIVQLVKRVDASRLIILGDVKHQFKGPSRLEWRMLPRLFDQLCTVVKEIMILPGNHDGGIKKILGDKVVFLPTRGYFVKEEKVGLVHGHVWPSKQLLDAEIIIAGHLHPFIAFHEEAGTVKRRVWLRMRGSKAALAEKILKKPVKKYRGEITLLIMPSFNDLLSGTTVTNIEEISRGHGPLLRSGIFNLARAEVITIDGANLGYLASLELEA